uniref:Uncharacterized protein n=1 Tax=Cajanus cajan TaxID=3821 RepID=A0A151QRX0_CAJCA|nr:hypothetical protein KK1_046184 [Cajanus cajan]
MTHFDSRPAPTEDVKEVSLAEGKTVKIGVSLAKEDEEGLLTVLKSNVSAFAWSAGDMPGIDPDFLCHRLMVDPNAKPVTQKRRNVHSSTRDTPFNLVYGTDAMIPIKIAEPSVRSICFTEEESEQGRRVDLDLITETREKARINQVAAQRRAAFKYNTKVVPRDFVVGDLVLKRAQLTQLTNKLSPKWVGPYKIDDVVGKGAYPLRTLDGGAIPRTWNAANLRFYYS